MSYKIYAIKSRSHPDLQYIGSTKQRIKKRLSGHCSDYKKYLNGNNNYVTSFDILKYNDYYVELYCNTGTDDKSDAHWFEGQIIRAETCVNKHIPGRTVKEYYETNKDKIKDINKEYYETNREYYKEYQKQYREQNQDRIKEYYETNKDRIKEYNGHIYICECGGRFTNQNRARHFKTKKHKNFIK